MTTYPPHPWPTVGDSRLPQDPGAAWTELTGHLREAVLGDDACPYALWWELRECGARAWTLPLRQGCTIAYLPGDLVVTFRDQVILARPQVAAGAGPDRDQLSQIRIAVRPTSAPTGSGDERLDEARDGSDPASPAWLPAAPAATWLPAAALVLAYLTAAGGLLALFAWILRDAGIR
jgi:hypothetical protein